MCSCQVSVNSTTRVASGMVVSASTGRSVTQRPDPPHPPPPPTADMSIDLRGLRVGVAHPVLERPHRRATGGHPCPEGVAQLVKRDPVDAGAVDGLLEAPDELRAVEWLAGLGMAEN